MSSVKQHLKRWRVVLGRLQYLGFKAKLSKSSFFQKEVCYLGHLISKNSMCTDPC